MGAGDATIKCLAWLANPARAPSNVPFLTGVRSGSLLSLFASMVLWTLACIYRPWKLQMYKGHQMEIGVWKICRVTPKVYQCYSGWYELHFKWWFVFYRYLMIAGIAIELFTFIGMCVELVRRKPMEEKPWVLGTASCGLAALCFFTSLVLFYLKFEWEFAEQKFGWPIMGWNEETPDKPDYIETVGYPYIMAWVALVVLFISTYLFYYTACEERLWLKEEKRRQKKAKLKANLLKAAEQTSTVETSLISPET